jgi:hypothetical protein
MNSDFVNKQIDSVLESLEGIGSNLPSKITEFWADIEDALQITLDAWDGDDPADEVEKSWDKCRALLEKDTWTDKDIEAFKEEWRDQILGALEFVQSFLDDEKSTWRPISRAWDKIDKLLDQ